MELYVNQEDLSRALAGIQGVIERRSTNQNAGHALLEAGSGFLKVTATDNEITLVTTHPANVTSTGEICVNASHFYQVARSLPVVPVHLLEEENHRLVVDAGPAHFKIMGTGTGEFPSLPILDSQKSITLQSADLKRLIEQTLFAIPLEDNRYGLNGGHLESVEGEDGGLLLRVVSTDGSRLCYAQAPYQGEFGMGRKMLVSRKALNEIKRLVDSGEGEACIGFGDRTITVTVGSSVLHARLVDGEFPPYRKVLPTVQSRRAKIERVPFLDALKRVALEAQDKASTVRLKFDVDELVASARSVEHGEARHPVPIDFQGSSIQVGFNVRFFLDVVSCVNDAFLELRFDEALSPCIIRPLDREDALFVVMPIRLD